MEIAGGIIRLYHLLIPIVVISLYKYIPRALNNGVGRSLLAFMIANIIAALFSQAPGSALASLSLLSANMGIALAISLILISGRLQVQDFIRIALKVAIVSVIWSVLQVSVYKLSGFSLALSEPQSLQVVAGFGTGFRTEANTFAKYLNSIFLLVFPTLLYTKEWKKSFSIAGLLFLGMLVCLTRSALYGLSVTLAYAYFWYVISRRGRLLAPKPVMFIFLALLSLAAFSLVVGGFNDYSAHKLEKFFDSDEILEGGSSGFRLMSQAVLIEAFLNSIKTIVIGNGWGQVIFDFGGIEYQAGGGELITVLAYGGIISSIFYFLYQLKAINSAKKLAIFYGGDRRSAIFEGVMFSIVGLFVTGQINGAMIAPEYWSIFGVAIYCGHLSNLTQSEILASNFVQKSRLSLI